MLRVIVTLAARPEMDLITEHAAKRQGHARAVHTILENLDCCDFPVPLDLAFDRFECHKRIIPRLREIARGTRETAQFPLPIVYTDVPHLQA